VSKSGAILKQCAVSTVTTITNPTEIAANGYDPYGSLLRPRDIDTGSEQYITLTQNTYTDVAGTIWCPGLLNRV